MDFTDNLENFLRQRITWIHIQSMNDAQKVHLDKLVKEGKASNTQLDWHRYLHSLPPDPNKEYYEDSDGKKFVYKTKDYDGDENKSAAEFAFKVNLGAEDWKSLYKYFRDNFRTMDKMRDELDGVFAKPYLDKWFGDSKKDGKPFWKASPNYSKEAINNMIALGNILSLDERDPNGEKIDKVQMLFNLARSYQGALQPKNKSSFIYMLQHPEQGDADFFNDVQELFSLISQNAQYDTQGAFAARIPTFLRSPQSNPSFDLLKTARVINDGVIEEEVSDQQILDIKYFYPDLIFNLYDKEKRQTAFKKASAYPSIVSIINNVKSNNDYKEDAFNKIVPKEDDKRTNLQYIDKVWSDYKEGTWDKLGNRHRRHSYSSQAGEDLVGAIYKNKIKPSDGLEKILAEKDKIKEQFFTSDTKYIPQFNWIFDVLKDAKTRSPKAFADALRDGQKMHHIVEYIIQRAAREDKLEHAKTMLEMLTVMQYGPFASDTREKLFGKDMKWTFFGDMPSLKGNELLKFMANAVDRVIKFGARATFEILNFGWRQFQRRGLKFGTNGYKKFMNGLDKWYGDVMLDPNMTPEKLKEQIELEKAERENLAAEISQLDSEISALKSTLPPDFNDYDVRKKQFDADEAYIDQRKSTISNTENNIKQISAYIQDLGLPTGLKPSSAMREIDRLNKEIDAMEQAGADPQLIDAKYDEVEKYSNYMQARNGLDKENADYQKLEKELNLKTGDKNYTKNKSFFARGEIQELLQKESQRQEKSAKMAEYDTHIEIMQNRVRDLDKNAAKDTPTTVTVEKDGQEENKDVDSISKQRNIASELTVYWDFQQSGISDNINPFRHQKRVKDNFIKSQENLEGQSQFDVMYAQFGKNYTNVGYTA